MSARANILARIRTRQGKAVSPRNAERELVAQFIAAHPQSPRPHVDADLVVRFRDRAAAVGGDVTLVTVAGAGHTWLLMPWHIAQCAAWFDTQFAAPGRNRP